jgi:hypothetical protein
MKGLSHADEITPTVVSYFNHHHHTHTHTDTHTHTAQVRTRWPKVQLSVSSSAANDSGESCHVSRS